MKRYRRSGFLVGVLSLLLVACGPAAVSIAGSSGGQAQPVVAAAEAFALPDEIDPASVAGLYDSGEIAVIDVREAWEYEAGHIPGAALIPLGELAERVDEVPRDRPVVLVCRSDNRSGQALRLLARQGFDNLSNMMGGMLAWEAAGYATAR